MNNTSSASSIFINTYRSFLREKGAMTTEQIEDGFEREGYKIAFWEEVHAPARRRKMYFDGEQTLAAYINSVTDVDDMVRLFTAYSIEWNKIHHAEIFWIIGKK